MQRSPALTKWIAARATVLPGLLSAAVLSLWPSPALASPAVWVAPSTKKVRPSARPSSETSARLSAARNELEAFQIVVRDPGGVEQLSARAGTLTGPGGATIPASAMRLYRVGLVNLTRPSDEDGGTGRWPDPLLPAVDDLDGSARRAFPFDVPPDESRAIWVEVLVPRSARAGTYRGEVTLSSRGAELARVELALRGHDFALPSTPTLRTYFQASDMNVCQGHYQGDATCGGSDTKKVELLDRYARLALDHRISLGNVFYLWPRQDLGDWAEFDHHYGPLLDGTAATRLRGAKLTSALYMGAQEPAALSHFDGHFSDRGWLDRALDYTADEPQSDEAWAGIGPRARQIRQDAPGLRTLVTTSADELVRHQLQGLVDLVVPVVNYMDGRPGFPHAGDQSGSYKSLLRGGQQLWMYQSCMSHGCGGSGAVGDTGRGYPSLMIDHSGTRNRSMHWATFRYGATGDLYWETLYAYRDRPWSNVYYFSGNGDGTLFYPGTPDRVGGRGHTPVASQRLKLLRDGVEDFEYLSMCARLGDPAFAAEQARRVMPEAYSAGNDPSRIEEAREALARRIEELRHQHGTGG